MLIYRTTCRNDYQPDYMDRTQNSSNSIFSVFQERGRFKRLKNKCSNEIRARTCESPKLRCKTTLFHSELRKEGTFS